MEKLSSLKFILLLPLLGFLNSSLAQIKNTPFQHFKEFSEQDSSKLFFRFENFNFVKNNEYNSDFTDGVTWIGYIATPKMVYYPTSNFRIEAGARFQKYSGREDFTETEPIFSAIYHASDKIDFILGTLNQDHNHKLSEPIFEPERFFSDNAENGFQILYHSDRFNLDTWINWEKFILANDPFQERFTFGLSSDWQLNKLSSKNKFSIPVQTVVTHRGGEIDSSDGSVQTVGNYSAGLQFTRKVENSRITSWTLKVMAHYFSDNSSEKEFIFDKGHAFYPQFGFTTKQSQLHVGYWNAYQFAASRGSELFQSVSFNNPGFFENRRELATLNYFYEHEIAKGINLGGKLDAYYDLKNSKENFAAAIYLQINGDFFLKKIKWN